MDFLQTFQTFGPALSLVGKKAGEVTDSEIKHFATVLTGLEEGGPLLQLMLQLRADSPDTPAVRILGSEPAQKLVARLNALRAEKESSVFCKCPACEFTFEQTMN